MAKWMVAAKKADFNKIAEEYGISPVLARIMRNRDVMENEQIRQFLHGTLADLHDPYLLKDMEEAVLILERKINEGLPVRIIGDYDVDGICATYILKRGLSLLGAKADRVIPHRMKDGYGLNDSLILEAAKDGIDTIVTCDNGIAAADQILLAKEKGMTVVVTDHHEVPFEEVGGIRRQILVKADAVVDPKREDCLYPFKQICGAVVAYKLIEAMFIRKQKQAEAAQKDNMMKQKEELMTELLPFAALATVCDVMELKDENRIIVKYGLKQMHNTENLGLKALLMVNGIEDTALSPYHAGFILGPCLNATGRLDTATRALSLFEAAQKTDAVTIATDLKNLNDSRKKMTEDGVTEAIHLVENSSLKDDKVLVVYLPDCHESLAGIIAGKVKEKFGKPAFVLTKGEEGVKGSGRSIEAYSMYEEMSACKELFTKYGGHKMAAGLSLAGEEMVDIFRKTLNKNCRLTDEDYEEIIHIDVPMPLSLANKQFIKEISYLEPFGMGNPKPLFARKGISLLSGRIMGKNRNVGKYRIADEEGNLYDMIYFGDFQKFDEFLKERFGERCPERLYGRGLNKGEAVISIAYCPEMNYFGGKESVADTAKVISCYADIIAMRHPKEGAPKVAAMNASIPVINAGDGGHNHPTQTLADLLTIYREKGRLNNLTVGLCGDLKFGRTVHSLINALARYTGIKIVLISPKELNLPDYVKKDVMDKNGMEYVETSDLEAVMPDLDILYMTRVQKERFFNEEEYLRLKDSFILTPEKLDNAKEDLCIMHPLPRVNEISVAIDNDKRACYFKQVMNGKLMRMALILKLLEVK